MLRTFILSLAVVMTATLVDALPGIPIEEIGGRVAHAQVSKLDQVDTKPVAIREKLPTTCTDYQKLISQYDWDTSIASAIMMAESKCNTDAVGDTWPINSLLAPSCGLMQVRTLPGRPSCEELKKPSVNVEWAYKLYKSSGFKPWTMYNNGQYQRYL